MNADLSGYAFGTLTVDGEEHREDLIVLPGRVVTPWWRRRGHRLQLVDLEDVLDELPEVLVVGTGHFGRMNVARDVEPTLRGHGVTLVALRSGAAVQRFTELSKDRVVALAIHLTC